LVQRPTPATAARILRKKEGVFAEAVGHVFDELDLVVDVFDEVNDGRETAESEDAFGAGAQPKGEVQQRPDAAAQGFEIPVARSARSVLGMALLPSSLRASRGT
jgi:hypothetical protein